MKMTKKEAFENFKSCYDDLKAEVKKDYCSMQLQWSSYTDQLCKEGTITQSQFSRWSTPFK